jgi:BCD family chlorophyll transporter-like MFS transporter
MATLAFGGVLAAVATAWMGSSLMPAIALAVVAFTLIGLGVGAAGTSLLVLLAKQVDPQRRAAAATIVWIMMIAGFAVTAGMAGQLLDPFSPTRLVAVTAAVSIVAFLVSVGAVWGVESRDAVGRQEAETTEVAEEKPSFRQALSEVWTEPQSRRFAIFIFVSMLAYGAQDLILEPFAGAVFAFTPGKSTQLSGIQHGGVLTGMILVALAVSAIGAGKAGSLRQWTIGGCLASAAALAGLAISGFVGPAWPLGASVFFLGVANGAYAIAAIGSMMALVGSGKKSREGVRMGLWGAAQALAFGSGGFMGTVASDLAHYLLGSPVGAYAVVFGCEAALFVVAAGLAARVGATPSQVQAQPVSESDGYIVEVART